MKLVKIELFMDRKTWEEFRWEVEKWPILVDWETYLQERNPSENWFVLDQEEKLYREEE
jgi:dihydrofolate reductase